MNVVKCLNEHFFDGDKYRNCPHCGAPVNNSPNTSVGEVKDRKKGLFGRRKKDVTQLPNNYLQPEQTDNRAASAKQHHSNVTVTADANGVGKEGASPFADNPENRGKSDVTIDIWRTGYISDQASHKNAPANTTVGKFNPESSFPIKDDPNSGFAAQPSDPLRSGSLRETVRNVSASSENKTMSYFSALTEEVGSSKKQNNLSAEIDPVVGWLVGISGVHFGESFCIGAGMNSIGRSSDNRIVLSRDPSVSREKHALITYEPKHRRFYVKPGDSTGLTYVNDEYISETRMLSARDVIELGNSRFIFVPLCGEDFSWEDYMRG